MQRTAWASGIAMVGEVDQRLRKWQRLRKASEFREAYAQGRSYPGRYMVLWLRSAPDARLRLGVVAGRSIGSSVERNRARRRLRELYRRLRYRFMGDVDIILVARRPILEAHWDELTEELLRLAKVAGVLRG